MLSKKATIYDCSLIFVRKIENRAGNLSPIEGTNDLPFDVSRVFYIYDIPGGKDRGAHAHKECHQFLVAASGSFSVMLDDGRNKKVVNLNRPYMGVHVPPGIWAAEIDFSSGAICLVLASHKYDEKDYIRDYQEYLEFKL